MTDKFRSLQDVFDKVGTHLLTQGHASIADGGDCAYRGEKGRSCAVGCLIPDDIYSPKMEGMSADTVLLEYPKFAELFDLPVADMTIDFDAPSRLDQLLLDLQNLHDFDAPDEWARSLHRVAKDHGLSTEALEYPNGGTK